MTDTGYLAQTTYTAGVAQTAFSVGFPALASTDVKLATDGIDSSAFTISGDLPGGSGTLTYSGTALVGGEVVRLYRRSPETFALLGFQSSGADPLAASDLDTLAKGLLYLWQEEHDRRLGFQWVTISATHTVEPESAQGYLLDYSGGDFTATLPAAADWRGVVLAFKTIAHGGNTFTLAAADNIDGVPSVTLTTPLSYYVVSSTGSEWRIIGNI